MNYKNLVLSLGLAAVSSGVASAQAAPPRPPVQASEIRLTLNLSLEHQIPNLKQKDGAGKSQLGPRRTTNSWNIARGNDAKLIDDDTVYHELGQTSVRTRYGNNELIADLRAITPTSPLAAAASGWYISAFTNAQGQIYAIYARNITTSVVPVRLDPTYISLTTVATPAPVVPSLTQVPPTADPAAVVGAVDKYAYNDSFRLYDGPTRTESTYLTKGTRTISARFALTITTPQFPTALTGLVRFDNVANANPGANFPPTWIIKSIESKALILAGTRNIANELGVVSATPVLVDGTISGTNGVPYDNSTISQSTYPALPANIVAP